MVAAGARRPDAPCSCSLAGWPGSSLPPLGPFTRAVWGRALRDRERAPAAHLRARLGGRGGGAGRRAAARRGWSSRSPPRAPRSSSRRPGCWPGRSPPARSRLAAGIAPPRRPRAAARRGCRRRCGWSFASLVPTAAALGAIDVRCRRRPASTARRRPRACCWRRWRWGRWPAACSPGARELALAAGVAGDRAAAADGASVAAAAAAATGLGLLGARSWCRGRRSVRCSRRSTCSSTGWHRKDRVRARLRGWSPRTTGGSRIGAAVGGALSEALGPAAGLWFAAACALAGAIPAAAAAVMSAREPERLRMRGSVEYLPTRRICHASGERRDTGGVHEPLEELSRPVVARTPRVKPTDPHGLIACAVYTLARERVEAVLTSRVQLAIHGAAVAALVPALIWLAPDRAGIGPELLLVLLALAVIADFNEIPLPGRRALRRRPAAGADHAGLPRPAAGDPRRPGADRRGRPARATSGSSAPATSPTSPPTAGRRWRPRRCSRPRASTRSGSSAALAAARRRRDVRRQLLRRPRRLRAAAPGPPASRRSRGCSPTRCHRARDGRPGRGHDRARRPARRCSALALFALIAVLPQSALTYAARTRPVAALDPLTATRRYAHALALAPRPRPRRAPPSRARDASSPSPAAPTPATRSPTPARRCATRAARAGRPATSASGGTAAAARPGCAARSRR